jgi:tRNA nucleotidyltransferase (CCA-adding enzyme)
MTEKMNRLTFSFDELLHSIPEEVWQLLEILWQHKIMTVLVGGATRDYVYEKKIAKDLDFEVQLNSNERWPETLEKAAKIIQTNLGIKFERKSFSIISFNVKDFQLEFAPARLELYGYVNHQSATGHSDFEVEMPRQLAWEKAFSRRDFSINSIGLLIQNRNQAQLIDPYQGIEDLNQKIIRPIGDNFYRDPVRFLRAIRFKQKINGQYSPELVESCKKFNCSKITLHYFKYESFKYGFWDFCHEFFKLTKTYTIAIPDWLQKIEFIKDLKGPEARNENDVYAILTSLNEKKPSSEIDEFAIQFRVNSKVQQEWKQLNNCLNNLINYQETIQISLNNSFEDWSQQSLASDIQRSSKIWAKILEKNYQKEVIEYWQMKHPLLMIIEKINSLLKTLSPEQIPSHIAAEKRALYLCYLALQKLK